MKLSFIISLVFILMFCLIKVQNRKKIKSKSKNPKQILLNNLKTIQNENFSKSILKNSFNKYNEDFIALNFLSECFKTCKENFDETKLKSLLDTESLDLFKLIVDLVVLFLILSL